MKCISSPDFCSYYLWCLFWYHFFFPQWAVVTAGLKNPLYRTFSCRMLQLIFSIWMWQRTKAVIPKRGNSVGRNTLPEYNVLSDSSENFNHDSSRAHDSMVSPGNLSYNKNVSVFLLTFLAGGKKATPLICSKLQLQAKTSAEEKHFWPSTFIYTQDTISFCCRKSPAHSVVISSKVN